MVKKEKEEREKPIQFYVSERELKEIEEFTNISKTSKSEFIRQAISDKIMRMKTPEVFEAKGMNGISKSQIKAVLETTINSQEKINLLVEKMDLIIEKEKLFDMLSEKINKTDLIDIDNAVSELLAENKTMKLEDLVNKLGRDENTVLKVLSLKDENNKAKYTYDMKTERFKKNV